MSSATVLLFLLLSATPSPQAREAPTALPTHALGRMEGAPGRVLAVPREGTDGRLSWDYRVLGRRRASPGASGRRAGAPARTGDVPGPPETLEVHEKALVNCFRNTMSNGFFSVGTTGTEWMNWAAKSSHKTEVVGRFVFRYATNARGRSEPGGTGASIGLSFFTGTTGFCERGTRIDLPGDDDDVLDFTGLPGATGSRVSPAYTVTVDLPESSVFCWPDGRVGWSYVFREPADARTGPLLTAFSTNTGWNDAFDLWRRPDSLGTCAGTFFTSSCSPPLTFLVPGVCSGFFLSVWELSAFPASQAVEHPENRTGFRELEPPVAGEPWRVEVDLGPGRSDTSLVALSLHGLADPVPLTPPARGVLLIQAPFVLCDRVAVEGRSKEKVAAHEIELPAGLSLLGTTFRAQAFTLRVDRGRGADHRLEALNALDAFVGLR